MLYPYLHWISTNEKCSIVGAIPSSLLKLCYIQEGFGSIQQHICTRLTPLSNSMVSDTKYIWHYYDIMNILAASCNDTRSVINRVLGVSEYKHGNLVVRGSGYSYIFGSVDSKQTVKIICAWKKYISWSTFYLFIIEYQSRHLGAKVIQKWLEKRLEGYLSRI